MRLEEEKTYKFRVQKYTQSKIFLDHLVVYINNSRDENSPRMVFVVIPDDIDNTLLDSILDYEYFVLKIQKLRIVDKVITVEPYKDTMRLVNEK
jgi:hypothetical protein